MTPKRLLDRLVSLFLRGRACELSVSVPTFDTIGDDPSNQTPEDAT